MSDPDTSEPAWLGDWSPVTETRTTEIAAHPVAGLAAWLDADPPTGTPGQPLPPLWHWVALSEWPPTSAIGPDGHPSTGGFLPVTPYPRRMWVGCTVDLPSDAPVGAPVVVDRVVESIEEKDGRQGAFALVTVRLTVASPDGEPYLVERTRLAYRGASPAAPLEPVTAPGSDAFSRGLTRAAPWTWQLRPDPPILMMFSALTANAHRIHYDVPYATGVEGYPGLLVHGPLMAVVLADVVRREAPDQRVSSVTCRALRPFYLGATCEVRRPADTDGLELELASLGGDGDDTVHMTASFTLD